MRFVEKGWGWELWIENSPLYCGKLLHFAAGKRCSAHYHKLKTETFYLASGRLIVMLGEHMIELRPGHRLHVPPNTTHQMLAIDDSDLYEFSTQHFEEDSYRLIKGD